MAADKGYVSGPLHERILAHTGVRLVAATRANMQPNPPADAQFIRTHRRLIETLNSQLETMGLQRLRAHTLDGFVLKVQAALLALSCARMI